MRRKLITRMLACLLCFIIAGMSLPYQAFAANETGHLTVDFHDHDTKEPLAEVNFHVYLVAADQGEGYQWNAPFDGYQLGTLDDMNDWETSDWIDMAIALAALVEDMEPTENGTTDNDGRFTISGLQPGLYLVTGESKSFNGVTYMPVPFLAALKKGSNPVYIPKYEFPKEARKTEVAINGEPIADDGVRDFGDYAIGPAVKVGDQITYNISWNYHKTVVDKVVITDYLDKGVDFISASYEDVELTAPESKATGDNIKISYDESTHTVTWILGRPGTDASGFVTLTVEVNGDADSGWNYKDGDDSLPDHCIYNQATVIVDGEPTDTDLVRNPLEGLFIEKIHVIVSDARTDGYYEGIFETDVNNNDNPYELPVGAYDASNDLGFTERLDEDTEDNDYKKLFWHDPGNTVRYYIKVTNNTPDTLKHVVILDPVKTSSIAGTDIRMSFGGVAGSVANAPRVQGRTQTNINVERGATTNGVTTYSLTPIWAQDWGMVKVTLQVTLPEGYTYEGATFSAGTTGETDYDDTTRTVTWTYKTDSDDTNELDTVYLNVRVNGAADLTVDNAVCFFDNILDTDDVDPTNPVGSVYNQDDPEDPNNDLHEHGYLRWEIEELPGTNAGKSADGYDANVYIVWFEWDLPTDSVDEVTFWENTAYVQTLEVMKAQLESAQNTEEPVQSVSFTQAIASAFTRVWDFVFPRASEPTPAQTSAFALTPASDDPGEDDDPYEYTDKSDYSVDSIFANYSWPTIIGTMIASNTVQEAIVPPDTGDLAVTKTVTGSAGSRSKEFHFTVTLSDTSINGTYGNMTFVDGVADITLKSGETKVATGLLAGITYTVVEAEANQDGYTTAASGNTGTIPANSTVTAAFVNNKNGTSPDPGNGDLTVTKTVTGADGDTDKEFHFTVELSRKNINGTYGDVTFVDGVASFTLKHGESKVIHNLPEGITYTVTEDEANQDGYTTTASGESGRIADGGNHLASFVNDKPGEPSAPDRPGEPDDPNDPDNPNDPNNPDNPNSPDNPNNPPNLPQTGQLWWPIPLMLGIGLLLFICGAIFRKRGKEETPMSGDSNGQA